MAHSAWFIFLLSRAKLQQKVESSPFSLFIVSAQKAFFMFSLQIKSIFAHQHKDRNKKNNERFFRAMHPYFNFFLYFC